MIIKTALNASAGALHRHLTRADDGNEKIRLVDIRGCVSDDLLGALREMKATAAGTRCEKSFYHCSFAAPMEDAERLQSEAIWKHCAFRVEKEFGLENHARAIVHHFKDGRWHQHVVWNRIDPETGRAAHLSHEHRRVMKVAREIERDLKLTQVPSQRPEHRQQQRPPQRWEMESARRTKIDADQVRDQIAQSWAQSGDARSFAADLQAKDLILARGDRRPFVVVDGAGNFYALGARLLPGESARTLREKLGPVAASLPQLDEAKRLAAENAEAKRYKRGGKKGEGDRTHDLEGKARPTNKAKPGQHPLTKEQARAVAIERGKERGTERVAAAITRETTEAQQGHQQKRQAEKDEAQRLDEERKRQAESALMRAWQRAQRAKPPEPSADVREKERQRQQELRARQEKEREQRRAQQQGRGRSRKRERPEPD